MRKNTDQAFESIRIVGGLISSKVLQDARRYDLPGQSKEHYQIEPGLTFNDDIGRYWRIAQARWQEFQLQCHRQAISSHTIAQREWLIPLLEKVLDYRLENSELVILGEREFPITHSAFNHAVPLVLCGAEYDLDKGDAIFGQEGRKRSPMGLLQEYLNAESTALWAIVSNGLVLRLLRDNPAMTRPAYIEVDFARMFEEDNYADFATFWLTLHATRLEPQNNHPEQCWLEQWRGKGQDEGERALDKLRYGVADALRQLGTGFVAHKNNQALRDKLSNGELTTDAYFQQVLRLVYRFLFLLTAEDRNVALLPEEYEGQSYAEARKLYEQGYSLNQLREKARLKRHYDTYGDAWQQLLITFAGFAQGQPNLAQPALGGLFAEDQCADIECCELQNRHLFNALFNLCYFEHDRVLARINYRDMDTEEFGSVYESLLELVPQLSTEGTWQFSFMGDAEDEKSASGHSRKLTGSYYTPDSLVQELIKSALEPVIADRLHTNPQQPREAILSIAVCDPACGSGHFLLAAARRLATELAKVDAGSDQATENHYRHAMHDVVRHCIYGVDINPMAVELCKTGLWLESIEVNKPLTFLSHHIKQGNSLIGGSHESAKKGFADAVFRPIIGDDKKIVATLKQKNKKERQTRESQQQSLFNYKSDLKILQSEIEKISEVNEDTVSNVLEKESLYAEFRKSDEFISAAIPVDVWCASFFWPKNSENIGDICPTDFEVSEAVADIGSLSALVREKVSGITKEYKFFHWHIEFPEIFGGESGGFDVVLSNPPWEKLQSEEVQWFSVYSPKISELKGTSRKNAINDLIRSNPRLSNLWTLQKRADAAINHFIKTSGEYPLTGVGKFNSYAIFSELALKLINRRGTAGLVVPTGIATDDTTKQYFQMVSENLLLVSLFDFHNGLPFFKNVDSRFKFSLLTITAGGCQYPRFIFYGDDVVDIRDSSKLFILSKEQLHLLNPNTKTCPVFRYKKDADITSYIYSKFPIMQADVGGNSWPLMLRRIINETDDSEGFIDGSAVLDGKSYDSSGDAVADQNSKLLRVYEAKMIWHYDHRYASYDSGGLETQKVSVKLKEDSAFMVVPKYWFPEEKLSKFYPNGIIPDWSLVFRRITNVTNERTIIFSIVPKSTLGTLTPTVEISLDAEYIACFLAEKNSFIFDYISRQKISGTDVNLFKLKQLPCMPPNVYDLEYSPGVPYKKLICERVLELVYTCVDLTDFAERLGYKGPPFRWNEDRRYQLRCELDALFFYLYFLTVGKHSEITLPNGFHNDEELVSYVMHTFPIVERKEMDKFGAFRTKNKIIDFFNAIKIGSFTNLESEISDFEVQRDFPSVESVSTKTLPDNDWQRPEVDLQAETTLQLAAILRSCVTDISTKNARLALLVAMEPRILVPFLNPELRAEWLRLNGSDAAPLADGVTRLQPNTQRHWGEAIRQLRGDGLLIENLQERTWSPGKGLNEFPSQAWAEGRAWFVMAWLNSGVTVADVVSELPQELRGWLNENVA